MDHGCRFDEDDEASFRMQWLIQKRGKVQVLHFHYLQQCYAYELKYARLRWMLRMVRNLLAARVLGYRVVFTLHNLTPTYPLQPLWVDYLGHRAIFQLADAVIVHCQAARLEAQKLYGHRKNVYVLPHPNFIGVYPNQMSKAEARKRLEVGEENFVFLFFGGIRPNKGIKNLILSFQQLKHDQSRLIIAGSPGDKFDYLHGLKKLASNDQRITFFPRYIDDAEIQAFMNAADVVVLPFSRVLTSSSVMLALSFARPVIVPCFGCLPEQVPQDSGIFFEPGDVNGLRNAMGKCRDLDLAKMGQTGYEGIQRLSWDHLGEATSGIYGFK